jgi:hypothetical protein
MFSPSIEQCVLIFCHTQIKPLLVTGTYGPLRERRLTRCESNTRQTNKPAKRPRPAHAAPLTTSNCYNIQRVQRGVTILINSSQNTFSVSRGFTHARGIGTHA